MCRSWDVTDSRLQLRLCEPYVSAERGANYHRLIFENEPMDARFDDRCDVDENKRTRNWLHIDWTTTGTTEQTTTSGKKDRPEWGGNVARAALIAGLRMPEKECWGLDLTIDSYDGQDVNTHENGRTAQVWFAMLWTQIQWTARTCWKEDAKVDVLRVCTKVRAW